MATQTHSFEREIRPGIYQNVTLPFAYAFKCAPNDILQPDSKCHNSEPGTFNHECGKPAVWIGRKPTDLTVYGYYYSGFCDDCYAFGHEARNFDTWIHI